MTKRPSAAKPAAKANSAVTAALAAASKSARENPVALRALRNKLAEARGIELEIERLQETLDKKKSELTRFRQQELPEMFEKLGIKSMELEKDGNYPAYETKLKPWFSASLPKDEDKRESAIRYIETTLKCPDIVKKSYTLDFGKGDSKRTVALEKLLRQKKFEFDVKTGVHPSTLTAEVRRRHESGKPLSPKALEIIGAQVGKVVELKRKEDKTDGE